MEIVENSSNENTTFLICDDYSALKNSSKEQSNYDIKVNNFNKVAAILLSFILLSVLKLNRR